jgi:Phytochelatin synthase
MLDCCRSLESVKKVGITLDEFACLAQCNTLHAEIVRESTLEEFRHDVKKSTSSQGTIFLAVAYSRKVLEQTGDGHFSPLAAYSGEENDLVLVLDVARFKYGSYWIPLEAMWRAMNTVDGASGKMRGYCRLGKTGLTTDDPESISVVKSLMDKGSFKALLATKCLQQSPTLRDLQRCEELQDYARLIELIPVESIGQGNGSSQTVVKARQDALLEQISLMDLFFLALLEYLVDTGYSQMEPMGEISGSKEVMAAINSLKTQFAALHQTCCQEKSTDDSNTSVA